MRVKFTRKPDAEARANGRSLDPTTVMLHADGRLLQAPRQEAMASSLRAEDVTDLFDVEVADEWQVVLTKAQLDALQRDLDDAFRKARRVE